VLGNGSGSQVAAAEKRTVSNNTIPLFCKRIPLAYSRSTLYQGDNPQLDRGSLSENTARWQGSAANSEPCAELFVDSDNAPRALNKRSESLAAVLTRSESQALSGRVSRTATTLFKRTFEQQKAPTLGNRHICADDNSRTFSTSTNIGGLWRIFSDFFSETPKLRKPDSS
jgi:hypothetical protein